METSFLPRNSLFTTCLLSIFLWVGCGNSDPIPPPPEPTAAPTETAVPTPTAEPDPFAISNLAGTELVFPTSLQFGPDGRLYVAQRNGQIKAYTVVRNGANNYSVTQTETIDLIRTIQNHNDDGSPHIGRDRQLTGLYILGTAENPRLYVTSSDYREGGGIEGQDYGLDTNSGVISLLSCVDGVTRANGCEGWEKVDLVRGLPRSEQNHSTNGILVLPEQNVIYVAQGGFTDTGAPSRSLGFTAETALSAAILKIDLDLIMSLPTQTDPWGQAYKYNLPTLNTVLSPNGPHDFGDPWGGNDGLNQAVIVENGPVQLFASGFRNPFDLLLTSAGHLLTVDNGSNFDWGGYPEYEESYGCTNNVLDGDPGSTTPGPNPADYPSSIKLHDGQNGTSVSDRQPDKPAENIAGLHLITEGYYAGHANPTRGNPAGAGIYLHDNTTDVGEWLGPDDRRLPEAWPPVPADRANPVECDFQGPIVDDSAIANLGPSTNGLTEYTASNLNGALQGVILGPSYTNDIFQVRLTKDGKVATNCPTDLMEPCLDPFASGFGSVPLDIRAIGDSGVFPGTVWVTNHLSGVINIFEPRDYTADQPVQLPAGTPAPEPEPEERPFVYVEGELVACVNIGGPEIVGQDGRTFMAEDANPAWIRDGKQSETITDIANTEDDALFQTDRWGPMELFIPVPEPGVYIVELFFAEIFYGVNTDSAEDQRVFNANIEGFPALRDYDINQAAGGPAIAIVEAFETTTFDTNVNISLLKGPADNPKLSAVCVTQP